MNKKVNFLVLPITALVNKISYEDIVDGGKLDRILNMAIKYNKPNNKFIIILRSSDENQKELNDKIMEYFNLKKEKSNIKNIILVHNSNCDFGCMDEISIIDEYKVGKIIGVGKDEKDINMLLKINKLGGKSYLLNDSNVSNLEIFPLILSMLTIKFSDSLGKLFEMDDRENFVKEKQRMNDEALEIFYKYSNGIITKEKLLRDICLYTICDRYNSHQKFNGRNNELIEVKELSKKLEQIYSIKDAYRMI